MCGKVLLHIAHRCWGSKFTLFHVSDNTHSLIAMRPASGQTSDAL